jgi:hypothetical protein
MWKNAGTYDGSAGQNLSRSSALRRSKKLKFIMCCSHHSFNQRLIKGSIRMMITLGRRAIVTASRRRAFVSYLRLTGGIPKQTMDNVICEINLGFNKKMIVRDSLSTSCIVFASTCSVTLGVLFYGIDNINS